MLKMGHVEDPPVSTNMISIVFMIYHMKVHMFGYNLGSKKIWKSKIHILTIFRTNVNETSYSDLGSFIC